jgi:predicted ribosomally synthesized peptide with SipW-like signal peptide
MNKIMISLMTIALVGILIGGGVYAYFSDVETSTDNTFTAGTLNLEVGVNDPTTANITVSNLKPTDTGNAANWLTVNSGSISGNLTIAISAITNDENTLTEPEIDAGDNTPAAGELGTYLKVAVWLDMDKDGNWNAGDILLNSNGTTTTNSGADPLTYDYLDQYDSETYTEVVDAMAPADDFDFMVDYDFPSDANDNRAQSDISSFTITFTLNQTLG